MEAELDLYPTVEIEELIDGDHGTSVDEEEAKRTELEGLELLKSLKIVAQPSFPDIDRSAFMTAMEEAAKSLTGFSSSWRAAARASMAAMSGVPGPDPRTERFALRPSSRFFVADGQIVIDRKVLSMLIEAIRFYSFQGEDSDLAAEALRVYDEWRKESSHDAVSE